MIIPQKARFLTAFFSATYTHRFNCQCFYANVTHKYRLRKGVELVVLNGSSDRLVFWPLCSISKITWSATFRPYKDDWILALIFAAFSYLFSCSEFTELQSHRCLRTHSKKALHFLAQNHSKLELCFSHGAGYLFLTLQSPEHLPDQSLNNIPTKPHKTKYKFLRQDNYTEKKYTCAPDLE